MASFKDMQFDSDEEDEDFRLSDQNDSDSEAEPELPQKDDNKKKRKKDILNSKVDAILAEMNEDHKNKIRPSAPPTSDEEFMLQFQKKTSKRSKTKPSLEELQHHLDISVASLNENPNRSLACYRSRTEESPEQLATIRKALEDFNASGIVVIDKTVRFAGDQITIQQRMERDSAAHKYHQRMEAAEAKKTTGGQFAALDAYVSGLDGPTVINTVDKSQADWLAAKDAKKISVSHTGTGFLEQKAFLENADVIAHQKEVEERRLAVG